MQTSFVDAHHHLWDLEANPHYPWLLNPVQPSHMGDYSALQKSYRLADYLADFGSNPPVASVHVEANWRDDDPVHETKWLQTLADRAGYPQAIVCYVDLAADDAPAVLERQAQFRNVRGVRRMVAPAGEGLPALRPGATILCDQRFLKNLKLLRRFDLSFDLQATPAIMEDAVRMADAHPDLPVALTHMGLPLDRSADGLSFWRHKLALMSRRPNVFVKLSGLAMLDPHWTPASIAANVRIVTDLFGPDRCMFGTNFPVDKLRAAPAALLTAFAASLTGFTDQERHAILAGTAARFYRLRINN